MNYDFAGWATKNDLKCADGRIIRRDAFKVNDGKKVPLVWNHQHNTVGAILGHAILENKDEGVYAYCSFNNTQAGNEAREAVKHGDVDSLSIWANNLEEYGHEVLHGVIREVSLVMAGANPGAFIESVVTHGEPMEEGDTEGILYSGEGLYLKHSIEETGDDTDEEVDETDEAESEDDEEETEDSELQHSDDGGDTLGEVLETLSDKQKAAVGMLINQLANGGESKDIKHSDDGNSTETVGSILNTLSDKQKAAVGLLINALTKNKEESNEMKHNMFEDEAGQANVISHSDMQQIFADAKRLGSLRDAVNEAFEEGGVLAHSTPTDGMVGPSEATASQTYGFRDPDMLFPEYKNINGNTPEWISRRMEWVSTVMGGVHRTPFSRIKSTYADITEDAARAKGYIKGNQKTEEVFTLLKRTTDPQTIYKKQKLDRDDIIDITDFDVVAWIKGEMRIMLDEEIARAILIGDGRLSSSDDKIQENHVRPIVSDVDLYNVKVPVTKAGSKEIINSVIRARKKYKGSGNPTFFTTEDVLTEMLLLEDGIGHKLYKTEGELATALRVSKIVTVEVMEGHKITVNNEEKDLIGVIVNLTDYNVGADKGGAISLFDDFDIDYNQYKYLIETRISGALTKPFSALTIYDDVPANSSSDPQG